MATTSIVKAHKEVMNAKILSLSSRGRTVERIHEILVEDYPDLTLTYIKRKLPRLLTEHAKTMNGVASVTVLKQLGQLEQLAMELSEEWERSKAPALEETTRTREEGNITYSDGGDKETHAGKFETVSSTKKIGRVGDPRLAQEYRGTLGDIRNLLGLGDKETLRTVVENLNITSITVNGDVNLHEKQIQPHSPQDMIEIAQLMQQYGMNIDGTPIVYLESPKDFIEAEIVEPTSGQHSDEESEAYD